MSASEDAKRLAEIGARCERATEGPWTAQEKPSSMMCHHVYDPIGFVVGFWDEGDAGVVLEDDADFIAHAREDVPWLLAEVERLEMDKGRVRDTVALKDPDGIVFDAEVPAGDGPRVQEKLDKLVRAYEQEPELLKLLREAGAAWQATESRLVRICQLLNVDYTCEEPETCEQVIERLLGRLAGIRHVVEQQTEFLRTGCDIQPSEARTQAKVFISMGRRALATNASKPEAVARLREGSRECDECDGSGQYFIDGKPQVCICVGEKGGGE